jgi:hypothetical protein
MATADKRLALLLHWQKARVLADDVQQTNENFKRDYLNTIQYLII